ncbi:hypothetical protein G3565_05185 [Escherichia coli]|nr:hypothetical protein [Escherichia coli]NES47960.1 hypothetical protein [Escherichia coli]
MVKSLLPPPKRHKIKEMKEQRTLKMYNNLVKLLCKSPSLKAEFKTDDDRKALIEMKYMLSKMSFYKFVKEYASDPFSPRWRAKPREYFYGGSYTDRIQDTVIGVEFEIDYEPNGVENLQIEKRLPSEEEIYVYARKLSTYSSRITLGNLDSLIIFYTRVGVDKMVTKLNELSLQQKQINAYKDITDLY